MLIDVSTFYLSSFCVEGLYKYSLNVLQGSSIAGHPGFMDLVALKLLENVKYSVTSSGMHIQDYHIHHPAYFIPVDAVGSVVCLQRHPQSHCSHYCDYI